MLQNRVTPTGEIIRTEARGTLMGNRGVIHDHNQNIVRPFKHKAWITCTLSFKGKHRAVMSPNRWTELFFLDEATAFAAGHRPCCECRRQNFNQFKQCWLDGNPEYGFDLKTSIQDIDEVIHKERLDRNRKAVLPEEVMKTLPDGTFIINQNNPFVSVGDYFHEWTPSGYTPKVRIASNSKLLTPRSIVNAFTAGYRPQLHGSLGKNRF